MAAILGRTHRVAHGNSRGRGILTEQIRPSLRDVAVEALLKSAGTAIRKTALHQKPGHLGPIASDKAGLPANTAAERAFL